MSYKLVRENQYDKKKYTFINSIKSLVSTILILGVVVTVSSKIKNEVTMDKIETEYQTVISYYQDIIDITADFFIENKIDSPEECFNLYTKLLWNGYFSNNKQYEYDIRNVNNIKGYYGIRIVTGNGDCKNNEDFFCRLMLKLGYKAYQVACVQSDNKELCILDSLIGNHVITVVEHEGKNYYFDTTNLCSYEQVNINYLYNSDRNLNIYLRPITSYIYGYNGTIEVLNGQFNNISSKEEEIDTNLYDIIEFEKVLTLRKNIEPTINQIYENMNGE